MKCGIYLHVPFCVSKCPYCDFYSLAGADDALKDAYTDALIREMRAFIVAHPDVTADTLYFGGGTPSLLGGVRLARLVTAARSVFAMPDTAEITLEANPADRLREVFAAFGDAGGNRLSLGMQSASPAVLQALGRRHTPADVARTVADARATGLENISLDMMLAVPRQTAADIRADAAVCASLGASHVSAYLLKIEEGTPYFAQRQTLVLPDEDDAAEMYLCAVEALETEGYRQYEISNFAKDGRYSRHNLKYWNSEPYVGFGPAAHSFFDGKRWYYPRDIQAFIQGNSPVADEDTDISAGGETEYAMLRLRLREGLRADAFATRFGKPLPRGWLQAAERLPRNLVTVGDAGIALTAEGFLVSNALLAHILNL